MGWQPGNLSFCFFPLPFLADSSSKQSTQDSVDGQQGVLRPIIAPHRRLRACVRAGTDFSAGLLLFFFLSPSSQAAVPIAVTTRGCFFVSSALVCGYDFTASQLAAPQAVQEVERHTGGLTGRLSFC